MKRRVLTVLFTLCMLGSALNLAAAAGTAGVAGTADILKTTGTAGTAGVSDTMSAAGTSGTAETAGRGETPDIEEDSAAWWESLRASLPEEIAAETAGIETGETEVGFEYLFGLLAAGVRGETGRFRRVLFTLLGVVVLGGVAGLLTEDTSALKKPLGLVLSAATALALWGVIHTALARVGEFIADLTRFAEGLAPVMGAILAGGGAGGTGAVASSNLTLLLLLLQSLCGRVLSPLIAVCFAFCLVGAISGELHIDGITKNLRGIYMTVLGAVGVIATGAMALQTVLSSAADSMAMRTARYTVGSMIPLVGGTIGAALGTLGTSLTVIKSTVGVGAVVAVLLLTLPLLLSLYLTRLALTLTEAFARMMGFRVGEKLLGEFRGIFDMTLAVTALSGTLFLIYLAVFLKTALPLAA